MRTSKLLRYVLALTLASAATAASAADKLRFGFNWVPQMEMCGFVEAREYGLYRNAGLDVELVPGGPNLNVPQLVAAGEYDLAMGTALTTLNMRKAGIPGVTVAAMFQKSPITLVAHPGQSITKLEDLVGKPIAIPNTGRTVQWAWLRKTFGFDDSQLRPFSYSPAPFLADKSAVQQGYITEDGFFLGKALGAEPVSLLLADRGYPEYATTIFTTEQVIASRHDVVRRFVQASREGFAQCNAGDVGKTVAALAAENKDQTPELSQFKLAQMRAYKLMDSGDAAALGIGAMTDTRWAEIFDTMSGIGLYPRDFDYRKAYTLEFVSTPIK